MDIHQTHIDALLQSTQELFDMMIGMPIEMATSPAGTDAGAYDLSGTIQITGDITGFVTIGFEQNTALTVVERLLGVPMSIGSSDFSDAIGEVTNMIVGAAKSKLKNTSAAIGCPKVSLMPGNGVKTTAEASSGFIRCSTTAGKFYIHPVLQTKNLSKAS